MKRLVFFLILSAGLVCGQAFVQAAPNAEIAFAKDMHDFGSVKEEGKVYCSFEFTNTGTAALEIRKVTASCGCTTPTYPQEPIAPGAKGVIEVAYNTVGRPGNFSKSISVYSNAAQSPVYVLNIRGTVISKTNSPEMLYPKNMNGLRLKRTHIPFGEVKTGHILTETIPVYNNNEELPIEVAFRQVPKHLRVHVTNSKIVPGGTAIITIDYLPDKANDYGNREDLFYLVLNGQSEEIHKITLSANIVEDFSEAAKNKKQPKASYMASYIDMGDLKAGESKTAYVSITNQGEATLIIRKYSANCDCIDMKADRKEIAPGKTAQIKVELDSRNLHKKVRYYLEFITNDSMLPLKRIALLANITEK